jgi:Domain of unknown function (DUF5753)
VKELVQRRGCDHAQQLVHLTEVAERPNVELRILPFDAQTFEAVWIGFTILRFGRDAV